MQTSERWAEGPSLVESIWRFRYLVVAVTLLAGLAGYLISQSQPPVYETSTRLYVTNPATAGVFQQQSGMNLERYLPQQTERIRSARVLAAAAEELEPGTTARGLADQLTVEGDAELGTMTVSVQDGSPERAANIANAVADAYEDSVRTSQMQRVDRAIQELERSGDDIQAQIDELLAAASASDLAPGGQVSSQVGVLTQRVVEIDTLGQQLLVDARLFGSGVEFVEEAEAPTRPVAPTPRRTGAASAVLGALFASAFAYWRAGRGHRITSRDEPGRVLDVPLLGVLPTYKPPQHATLAQRTTLDPRTAEAYRFVYSSLTSILREAGAASVMVTSAGPGVGKTETSLQLAATAVRRGQNTLLIDADLRMRGLTAFLRSERSPGLLDLADNRLHADPRSLTAAYPLDRKHHLEILTSGRSTGEDAHLSESWFGAAFEDVVREFDMTVVDSPPLLAVADTSTIAGYTDAIVLVIREGSDLDDLERVRQRLRFVQQRLVGYVYLSPSALDDTDFDYGLVRSQAFHDRGSPSRRTSADSPVTRPAFWPEQRSSREPVDGSKASQASRADTAKIRGGTEHRDSRS
jgi:Mrp family chromosome partitioning ATPase/capsular polysaccharide biosynthesis protein